MGDDIHLLMVWRKVYISRDGRGDARKQQHGIISRADLGQVAVSMV